MSKRIEYFTVFGFGAVLYSLTEILFRGFTHWTMTLTGGFAFLLLYIINTRMKNHSLILRCIAGAAVITVIEFGVGCVVNRVFDMHVWDYSQQKFNILGQICPLFSMFWFLLCFPAALLSSALRSKLR